MLIALQKTVNKNENCPIVHKNSESPEPNNTKNRYVYWLHHPHRGQKRTVNNLVNVCEPRDEKTSDIKFIAATNPYSKRVHTHSSANTEIEHIANVHKIPCNVREMFTVYPRKSHLYEAQNKLTNS